MCCPHFNPEDDVRAAGSGIELYFDFFYGDPVNCLSPNLPKARKVAVSDNWHVASCKQAVPDGLVGQLDQDEMARIANSLDFLLLRLEAPVGAQPLEKWGGRRRGWIQLPPTNISLAKDAWIIIPQHPNGLAQRIDSGRFNELDQTGTRIRYSANAAKGSSGAPCFNHAFMLVGIHNAYVGPENRPLANQAIRFESIATVLRQHVNPAQNPDSYALRWSVSRGNESPQVVLGRGKLLSWLRDSMTANPNGLANRVYAAQADAAGAGCTFSIDVLHAEIRGTKTPRAVFGARGQQLPTTPEDFLLALIRELGIILDAGDAPPSRPNASSQIGALAAEIDKLERWLSEELPNWLGSVIIKHVEKQIDIRPEAKKALEYYEHSNQALPEEIRKNAEASEPIYVRPNAWDFAYVVIDELRSSNYRAAGPRTELKGEVRSLIAALVKGKPESLLHPGLRRLRWMFLGYLPDFVSANAPETNAVTLEVLDPQNVGVAEVAAIVDRIWQALRPKQAMDEHSVGASARYILKNAAKNPIPEFRMSALQQAANEFTVSILEDIGVD